MTLREGLKNAKGLGSTIEVVLKAAKVRPCRGCKKRKEWLDKKVPFK